MKQKLAKYLYFILVFSLSIPTIQYVTGFSNVKKLKGYIQLHSDIEISVTNWLSGDYQEKKELYLRDHFGFRPSFVRLHNQYDYSFYNQLHTNSVVLGKDEFLFEEQYIKAYYGKDKINETTVDSLIDKLVFVQRELKKQNKHLFVFLAPGKGEFFPEYIPDAFHQKRQLPTNYQYFVSQFKNKNINYFDAQDWFLKNKTSSPFPLYSKGGIHWSRYAELIMTDSLLNFLEIETNQIFPDLVLDNFPVQSTMKYRDNDIGESFNLLSSTSSYPMCYPSFHIDNKNLKTSPKVMVVADSFYWGMYKDDFTETLFGDGEFWYYNQTIYPGNTPVNSVDLNEKLAEHELIILMSTDANLPKFAYGFIEQTYELLKTKTP
ncbi:MAG: alginate O-acetyltransferase AlgX-related protein [Flavobacteriales bacterium]